MQEEDIARATSSGSGGALDVQMKRQSTSGASRDGTNGAGCTTSDLAYSKFIDGMKSFYKLVDEIKDAFQAERVNLSATKCEVVAAQQALRDEVTRVNEVMQDTEQITLNVGGHMFTTSISTLRNAPSPCIFTAMFSGRYKLKRSVDGSIFIDRDGRHFQRILNFLRDRSFSFPVKAAQLDAAGVEYLMDLRAEADYYGLIELVDIIDSYPYNLTTVCRSPRGVQQQDVWVYEDKLHDELLLSVDRQCQLVGIGLCGPTGAMNVQCRIVEVEIKQFNEDREIEAKTEIGHGCATFTHGQHSDGPIVQLMLERAVWLRPGTTYMLCALITGNETYCVEDCLQTVISGGVTFTFHQYESQNGTNETRGQLPELYVRIPATGAYVDTPSPRGSSANTSTHDRRGSRGNALLQGLSEDLPGLEGQLIRNAKQNT